MDFGSFFFGSSSIASVSAKSSVSSSSRDDSLLPPIPSSGPSLLTPATSADIGLLSTLYNEELEFTVVDAEKEGLPSFLSPYLEPPPVRQPYEPADALHDVPPMCYALDMFLQSKMLESEEFCDRNDGKKERLYFTTGYGLIQCVKALMSYEDDVGFFLYMYSLFAYAINVRIYWQESHIRNTETTSPICTARSRHFLDLH